LAIRFEFDHDFLQLLVISEPNHALPMQSRPKVLLLAPTRRAASETFIRANLNRLPFTITAYFGDERPLQNPTRLVYGLTILLSKLLTRIGFLEVASFPASLMTLFLIRRHRPELVMVEFGFEAVRVMEAIAWSGVPLVVHFRGSDASAKSRLVRLRQRYQRLMGLCSGVIVKSEPMRHTLLELGAPASRLLVSPSGGDPIRFQGADPVAAGPLLVAVGRLVPKKGPLLTLRAFDLMHRRWKESGARGQEPNLVVVGDGPLRRELELLIEAQGLRDCVRLTGAMDHDHVAALLRQARVFVQHSLVAPDGDSEGCPVAVIEAQLSGLPVVATWHGGIPAVVEDGESGFLVSEGDVDAMAAAMLRLVLNPRLAATFGQRGQERSRHEFTIDHHLMDLTQLVNSILVDSKASKTINYGLDK
jgi:glycosyltransferase involved in cell wall biosynthesis